MSVVTLNGRKDETSWFATPVKVSRWKLLGSSGFTNLAWVLDVNTLRIQNARLFLYSE